MPLLTYLRTDVTAVLLYRSDLVLAGIGSSVFVYSVSENSVKPVQRLLCLNGQKIYGLKLQKSGECCFVVFGGKQFTVVVGPSKEDNGADVLFTRMFEPVVCDDWLHSAVWTPGETESVSLLTAHNVVQKYNIITLSLKSQHSSRDNSLLYSGLLLALEQDVLVLAGTVYSEVILHVSGEDEPLHRLKGHKGVIFSITCHPEKNIIVTTSDDRSVRIWGPNSTPQAPWKSTEYWRNEIICKHELYGHNARVMRSSITDTQIMSVGEDSRVCFWTHDGVLVQKVKRHQNSGIWSIEAHNNLILTGGGDGAVTMQYLAADSDDYHESEVININAEKPKHVAYTAKENLFIFYESNKFIYYDTKNKSSTLTLNLSDEKTTYHTLSVSPCRRMCVLAARKTFIKIIVELKSSTDLKEEKVTVGDYSILSVHWAREGLIVVCSECGLISVLTVTEIKAKHYSLFELPDCKERWLTCAAADDARNIFILGDRCGGIHLFRHETKYPLKTLSKPHGRYGPTAITIINDEVISTGRDKTIKYFKINGNELKHKSTKELDFHWVERFLNSDLNIVCGFKEKMFVVYNLRANEKLLEIDCGGGHRSYDVLYRHDMNKNKTKDVLKFLYVKNSNINIETVQLDKTAARCIAAGSHSKEINCLKAHQVGGKVIFFSGGEDTTMRISSLDNEMNFVDLAVCKHLSSVRTLKLYTKSRHEILLISAGGRAQICIKLFKFKMEDSIQVDTSDLVDYMLKGTDKQRKGDLSWSSVSVDLEPETRIMDLDYIKDKDKYTVFAGCSDARVRVFIFRADKGTFKMIKESDHPNFCILKTICVKYRKHDILITCSTRGELAFWSATNVNKVDTFEPFFVTRTNKSGINSIAARILPDYKMLIATGGDDNAIHLNVLHFEDQLDLSSMEVLYSLVLDKNHSSAITGLCLVGDFILSTSIDQRITLYSWKVSDKIECNFKYQTYSDVADIKGMDVIAQNSSSLSVCVFGKGVEVFEIPTSQTT